MSNVFDSIRSLVPKRSRHILHNYHAYDAYIGNIVPFYQRDVVPGDNLKIYLQNLIREKPQIAPLMGTKDVFFRFFFVPYRILDENFESGVTGGDDGTVNYSFPSIFDDILAVSNTGHGTTKYVDSMSTYSLWDYFGFALRNDSQTPNVISSSNVPDFGPTAYLWRAYYSIWNNYFRDEDLQIEVNPLDPNTSGSYSLKPLNVNYGRDYFTSAATDQQKGIAPSFSVSGMIPVQWYDGNTLSGSLSMFKGTTQSANAVINTDKSTGKITIGDTVNFIEATGPANTDSNTAFVDLGGAVGFDVAELRQLVQIQKILERASRTGSRYTEWLRSFFSVAPSDARLNRPEYIGGYRQPIVNSEVLQTSNASTPSNTDAVGAMKGHGISSASTFIGKYFVKEYGVLIGLMYCRPKVSYTQGINRQWFKSGRYDFYLPQLCNLSEQGIYSGEIYYQFAHNSDNDKDVWSFQGAWSEMRAGTSVISGAFRTSLAYWACGRTFASKPNNNSTFIECRPADWQRFYNEQTTPQLYCETEVTEDIVRPITQYPEPGRLDHDM